MHRARILFALAVALPLTAVADPTPLVLVEGTISDPERGLLGRNGRTTQASRCGLALALMGVLNEPDVREVVDRIGESRGWVDRAESGGSDETYGAATSKHLFDYYLEEGCSTTPEHGFQILYSNCSFTIFREDGVVRIVLPPGGAPQLQIWRMIEAEFVDPNYCEKSRPSAEGRWGCSDDRVAWEAEKWEDFKCASGALACTVNRAIVGVAPLDVVLEGTPGVERGEAVHDLTAEATLGAGTRPLLGVQTRPVTYTYTANGVADILALQYSEAQESSRKPGSSLPAILLKSEGKAWASYDVPGIETVRAFYENFRQVVTSSGAATTMLGAMMGVGNEILGTGGFPLALEETISMRVLGIPTHKTKSSMRVTGMVELVSNADLCSVEPPADLKIVGLTELFHVQQDGNTFEEKPKKKGSPFKRLHTKAGSLFKKKSKEGDDG